jgi:hypothetical protein
LKYSRQGTYDVFAQLGPAFNPPASLEYDMMHPCFKMAAFRCCTPPHLSLPRMQHNLAFVFAFAFGFGFANVREIDEQNSEPFITVNRLLKTWVSGCFSQIPYPGPSSYQTSRFISLGRLNTTSRVASPGQTLRQSQVPYKTRQFTSHAVVLPVLALYSKQQHADGCWPIGPSQHVAR